MVESDGRGGVRGCLAELTVRPGQVYVGEVGTVERAVPGEALQVWLHLSALCCGFGFRVVKFLWCNFQWCRFLSNKVRGTCFV